MNKVTQEAVANAETMMKDAQSAFQTAFEKAQKSLNDANEFGKANIEAAMKSGEISSKSAEALTKELADIAKKNFDESVKASQELASVKTVNELFEKQTAFAKASFDTYTAQFKAIADLATKGAEDAFAPIKKQAEKAGEFAKNFQA